MTKYILHTTEKLLKKSREILIEQVGVIEQGNNSGQMIKKYLASIGLPEGNPYCMAGQYYCFKSASLELQTKENIPIPKTGLVMSCWLFASRHGQLIEGQPEVDDLICWKKPKTTRGHIERIIEVLNTNEVITIGFNTKNYKGTERDGEGVFKKKRYLNKSLGELQILGLIGWSTNGK